MQKLNWFQLQLKRLGRKYPGDVVAEAREVKIVDHAIKVTMSNGQTYTVRAPGHVGLVRDFDSRIFHIVARDGFEEFEYKLKCHGATFIGGDTFLHADNVEILCATQIASYYSANRTSRTVDAKLVITKRDFILGNSFDFIVNGEVVRSNVR